MNQFYTLILTTAFILSFSVINAQNVGIGESTPDTKLEIRGDDGTDLLNVKDHDENSRMYIQNQGNVGIGTENPRGRLHIAGDLVTSRSNGTVRKWSSSISSTQDGLIKMGELTMGGSYQNILITGKVYGQSGSSSGETEFSIMLRSHSLPSIDVSYWQIQTNAERVIDLKVFEEEGSGRVVVGFEPNAGLQSFGWDITLFERGNYNYWINEDSYVALDPSGLTELNPGNNHLSFKPGGNVGIGTTNPTSDLHVIGSVRFQGLDNSSQSNALMIDGNGNLSTRIMDVDDWDEAFSWGDHSIEGYLDEEVDPSWSGVPNTSSNIGRTGNVGIGTTSPDAKLDVNGDIKYSDQSIDNYVRKKINGWGTAENTYYLLLFDVSETAERVVGRVIGSRSLGSSYTGSLDLGIQAGIGGNGDFRINIYSNSSGRSSPLRPSVKRLTYNGNEYYAIEVNSSSQYEQPQNAYFDGFASSNAVLQAVAASQVSGVTDQGSAHAQSTYSGNVGIGTSAPSSRLHVDGSVRFQSLQNGYLRTDGSGNLSVVNSIPSADINEVDPSWSGTPNTSSSIGRTGFVGIGTTNPGYLLELSRHLSPNERLIEFNAHRSFDLRREDNESDASANLVFNSRVGGNYWEVAHDGSTILEFHRDSPAFWDDSGNRIITFHRASSRVGIGTASPDYTLDVAGNMRVTPPSSTGRSIVTDYLTTTYYLNGNPFGIDEPVFYPSDPNWGLLGTLSNYWFASIKSWSVRNNEATFSDSRVKENVRQLSGKSSLDKLMQLRGVSYDIIPEKHPLVNSDRFGNDPDMFKDNLGFIAQELKEVVPEMVFFNDETGLYMIKNHEQLFPIIIEAMKVQQENFTGHIKRLTEELDALKIEIEQLKEK